MSLAKLKSRTEKRCPDCDTVKPVSEFYKNRSTSDGLATYCKPCWGVRTNGYNIKSTGRGYHRRSYLRKAYGIELETYNAMFAMSDGKCWACGEPEIAVHPRTGTLFNLAVDHDHETNEVRGLLCFKCNTTIRSVGDDRQRLLDLVAYLSTGQPAAAR